MRRRKTRRWIENILLLAGAVGIGVWIWSVANRAVYQDWANWSFEHEARGEPATIGGYLAEKGARLEESLRAALKVPAKSAQPAPEVIPAPRAEGPHPIGKDGLVGRLTIPSLHLSTMVREGVGEATLRVAAGHIPGTAFPGQTGNVGVAAHRDTIFRALRDIHKNDVIEFETLGEKYAYQVESTSIVTPRDTYVLKPGKQDELTLVTCYPFYYVGSAPDRFIVRARELSRTPMGQELSAAAGQSGKVASAQTAVPDDPKPATSPPGPNQSDRLARAATETERRSGERKIAFAVSKDHSRQLAPGISFGLTGTDEADRRLDGWMWLMPERRTIWVRDRHVLDPVVFYGGAEGRRRELVITKVTEDAVTGYLLLTD
jgi:sortase A